MTQEADEAARRTSFRSALARGGVLGKLIADRDWSGHPMGPVDDWPVALRGALAICVTSRFPIVIYWGPQFRVLYNDAYVPVLGDKHPRALGVTGRECWGEIWPDIGDMLTGVLDSGEATWSQDLLLEVNRFGFAEEAYFTFSFSPIHDDGGVGGVFCAVAETTAQVLGERRWRLLREIAQAMLGSASPGEALSAALRVLPGDPADVESFAVLEVGETGDRRQRMRRSSEAVAVDLAPDLARLAADGRLGGLLAGAPSSVELTDLPWVPPGIDAADQPRLRTLVASLGPLDAGRPGFLALAYSPRLVADDSYTAFFTQLTGLIAAGMADAGAVEAQRQRAEALAALDRSKTAFYANMSHEFRTPLTLMLGPLHDALAASGPGELDAQQREWVELAYRNGHRLLKLVNALLDFARAESGQLRADVHPHDLAALTRDLAAMFRSAVEKGGVAFTVDCPPLPTTVAVDQEMWEQIVTNLIANAYKHTFDGEIAVRLRALGGQARLTVTDTGAGIPELELPRLFERFHRVEGAASRSHEGSGIGLSLVQELVSLHGGEIAVDSAPDRGSTFTVTIPLGSTADATAAPSAGARDERRIGALVAEMQRWSGSQPAAPSLPGGDAASSRSTDGAASRSADGAVTRSADGGRVLVVDDNADMRSYLVRVLAGRYDVVQAADADEAVELARRTRPDLIVSDVMMPGTSGLDLVQLLRADPAFGDLPVILLSARAGPESAVEGLQAGADDYLIKPFSADELIGRVAARLRAASARRGERATADLAAELTAADTGAAVAAVAHDHLAALFATDLTQLAVADGGATLRVWEVPSPPAGRTDDGRGVPVDAPLPIAAAVRGGEPIILHRAGATAAFPALLDDPGVAETQSLVAVPLGGMGSGTIGALVLSWTRHHSWSDDEQALLSALAGVLAHTLARVHRAELDRQVSAQIQQRLLHIASRSSHVVAAARYQPARADLIVGGDWYDMFTLSDGRVAAAVGDVVGKGIDAALVMGQLRSAIGACGAGGARPHEVLDAVDSFAQRVDGALCTTVAYLVLDATERQVSWCCAGHPPPVIAEGRSVSFADGGRRTPLGVSSGRASESATRRLGADALVLIYTDGLVERRGEDLDAGLERLRAAVERHADLPACQLCDTLLTELEPPGGFTDDVAMIALRLPGSSAERFVDAFPASAANLSAARARLRRWLGAGLPAHLVEDVIAAVGESLANAVEHGSPHGADSPAGIEAAISEDALRVTVSDTGDWTGAPPPVPRARRGHGLTIMRALADEVSIRPSALGTSVTLTWRADPAGASEGELSRPRR